MFARLSGKTGCERLGPFRPGEVVIPLSARGKPLFYGKLKVGLSSAFLWAEEAPWAS